MASVSTPSPQGGGCSIRVEGMEFLTRMHMPLDRSLPLGLLYAVYPRSRTGLLG